MNKTVIIGGGASGLMAAYSASLENNEVILLEKNGECGKKLNICGKGRGNITNTANLKEFIDAFGKNGKFLYGVFSQFFNNDLIDLFENNGLKTITERGGRVFPESQTAKHITLLFLKLLKENNVKIKYGTEAKEIIIQNNKISGVRIHDGIIKCDTVIIATGGKSYPKTGSTGDGYNLAKNLGHHITDLTPSICPILTEISWNKNLAGLSLKNTEVSVIDHNNKILRKEFGEMLFTHKGVSGPVILTLSKYLAEKTNKTDYLIKIDLKPALTYEELKNKLTKEFKSNLSVKNYFHTILPKSLANVFPEICNINPEKKVNIITKYEKQSVIENLKNLKLKITDLAPIDEAIITQGGIELKEINPKTLESKIIENLYFCGEIIDIDAKTGGFNLQAAFSTGYVAGKQKKG